MTHRLNAEWKRENWTKLDYLAIANGAVLLIVFAYVVASKLWATF